jgi:hypothetical protein
MIAETLRDLRVFTGERFSLKVSVPLAVVLFLSPYMVSGKYDAAGIMLGCLTVFISLLCLRIADDVSDIDYDKVNNGERALPSGRVDELVLGRFIGIAMPVIVTVNFMTGFIYGASVIALAIIYYASFFKAIKRRLPKAVRPFFSNVVFAIIPVYAGIISYDLSAAHAMLASFIYFAVLAHEWAHNVKETKKHNNAAIIAFVQFTLSGVFGCMFWFVYGRPPVFGAMLSLTSIQMLIMCICLIIKPSHGYARKFYIAGFTFFAIPVSYTHLTLPTN